jgi:hypothetical protein
MRLDRKSCSTIIAIKPWLIRCLISQSRAHRPWQLRDLLPIAAPGRWGLSQQHQAVVDVDSNDLSVFSPVVPLDRADGCDVYDQALVTKLEVVGTDQA